MERNGLLAAAMTISTRRFLALPCGVTLLATGRASPKPCAERVPAGTPLAVRNRSTLSARADDSSRLKRSIRGQHFQPLPGLTWHQPCPAFRLASKACGLDAWRHGC